MLWGVIQFTVKGAAFSDLLFVNTPGYGLWQRRHRLFPVWLTPLWHRVFITPLNQQILPYYRLLCFVLLAYHQRGIVGFIAAIVVAY
jgi:hypothetical protein